MGRSLSITIGTVLLATWIVGLLILAPSDTSASEAAETAGPRIRTQLAGVAAPAARSSIRPWPLPVKDGGWRMVTSRTTSAAWLYSTKTGKVYRVLDPKDCYSKAGNQGCLVPLPVFHGWERSDELPSSGEDY